MRLGLVPVRNRGDIVGKRLVFARGPPAQGLYGHSQIGPETDRIQKVPAVEAPLSGSVVLCMFQRAAGVRGAVDFRKSIAAAEVIFRSCSVDRRKFRVAINVELDLALAKPAVR